MSVATRMRRIMQDSCANIDFGLDEWDAHVSAMVSSDPAHEATLLQTEARVIEVRRAWALVEDILLDFYRDEDASAPRLRRNDSCSV